MSEYEHNLPSSEDPEWVGLVLDVENRFEAMNDALAELRSAVVRLSSYHPQPMVILPDAPAPESQEPAVWTEPTALAEEPVVWTESVEAAEPAEHTEEAESAEDDDAPASTEFVEAVTARQDDDNAPTEAAAVEAEETVVEEIWTLAAQIEDSGFEAEAQPDDEDPVRDEVSRIVAKSREELTASHPQFDGSWAEPKSWTEMDSTSEGSWPVARSGASNTPPGMRNIADRAWGSEASQDLPAGDIEPAAETDADEAARREEVARMVAEMRAGLGSDDVLAETWTTDADDHDRREEVARMVADLRGEVASPVDEAPEDEQPAPVSDDAGPPREPADDTRRESVAEMVARMRAEFASAGLEDETETPQEAASGDDADVRDAVRNAVEAARAEMASGWVSRESDSPAAEPGEKKAFSFPDWQNAHIEPSGPPVIVIKDPEGRVELARVYETLSQVNCDENAALLNYTPHSVTVGLNLRASVPSKEAMEKAIQTVFGRACRVESDGVRVSVDIGGGREHAA